MHGAAHTIGPNGCWWLAAISSNNFTILQDKGDALPRIDDRALANLCFPKYRSHFFPNTAFSSDTALIDVLHNFVKLDLVELLVKLLIGLL